MSAFPSNLDGAKVLLYTSPGDYGAIKFPDGKIAGHYRHLAICKYADDGGYYLFCCNENFEVVSDSVWNSADKCISVAASSYKEDIVWHQATDRQEGT